MAASSNQESEKESSMKQELAEVENDFDSKCSIQSDDDWIAELEEALSDGYMDQVIIRNICKYRVLPSNLRLDIWKICLNIASRGNAMNSWDGKLDLLEQDLIHEDCETLVQSLHITECDEESDPTDSSVISNKMEKSQHSLEDAEAVLTFYCKSRAIRYCRNHFWTDLLFPALHLPDLSRADLYNCFYSLVTRYIPDKSPAPYHLFRLLVLYHDPELCSFLDSHKVSPHSYASKWFETMFASHCNRKSGVTQALWDVYFQHSDPFYMFYLALVILVNAKEQLMTNMTGKSIQEISNTLSEFPAALEPVDIEDFCQLAAYFGDRTPQTLKNEYRDILFGVSLSATTTQEDEESKKRLEQMLCLQVNADEVMASQFQADNDAESDVGSTINFFLVDCRSAAQYNECHLRTAFHLDAMLMLRDPDEFVIAVDALLAAQEKSLQTCCAAGGEHLCFIGSGVGEEDQYMYMVVSQLLQKHKSSFVSVLTGGFESLLRCLSDVNVDTTKWIVGRKNTKTNSHNSVQQSASSSKGKPSESVGVELVKNWALSLKSKSLTFKEKLTQYIENTEENGDRHVNASYHGKPYRSTQPVFSIGDEDDHHLDDRRAENPPKEQEDDFDESEVIDLKHWLNRSNVMQPISCFAVIGGGHQRNAYLVVEGDDMVCLCEHKTKNKWSILHQRPLATITKITSKRSCPELITFKFGTAEASDDPEKKETIAITAVDRYLIPDAGIATKTIKQEIMKRLNE